MGNPKTNLEGNVRRMIAILKPQKERRKLRIITSFTSIPRAVVQKFESQKFRKMEGYRPRSSRSPSGGTRLYSKIKGVESKISKVLRSTLDFTGRINGRPLAPQT
jgi:hypothetical protein